MIHLSHKFSFSWSGLSKTALFFVILVLSHFTLAAQTTPCAADAGTLDAIDICVGSEQTILKATNRGDTTVPQGFQVVYLLTKSSGLIVEQLSNAPVFSLPDSLKGLYTLHTLVYNTATLNLNNIIPGQTTGFELNKLLIQGGGNICAALDVKGVKVRFGTCDDICFATAGTLKSASNNCLQNGKASLHASVQTPPIIPPGYTRLYLLTSGNSLIIRQISTTPSFQVNTTGQFKIHTLVYDSITFDRDSIIFGITTGFDIKEQLVQGGGNICGALDVVGAAFQVAACPPICTTQAGKLKPDNDPCLWNGKARLIAKTIQNPIVPQGYQVGYVLTSGYGLIIQQIGTSPDFMVNTTGKYTIHSLVYNPNTLNLNIIQPGITPASVLNNLLIQGGGAICGSLDMIGATFDVKICPCDVKSGKLKPDNDPCFQNGTAILKAKFLYQPVVPAGYKVIYLLASGNNLVIEQTSNAPYFSVNRTGYFNVHALVYHPNTFNVNNIYLGVTKIHDIKHLSLENGGDICAALDADGAAFYIQHCVVCVAKAGKIKPANEPCLLNNTATLKAQTLQNPVIPTGYALRYLLTSGANLVIHQISKTPSFDINSEGRYNIHTLVYDSITLKLNTIKLDSTSAFDVQERLIQGGGIICGALDLEGAKFNVKACENVCSAGAGTLFTTRSSLCLNPSEARLVAHTLQAPIVPSGYKVIYLLTSGNNLVIEQVKKENFFQVNLAGSYRIHTLVYHPASLDLDDIQLGTTRASMIHQLLIQGGGSICGALDLQGVSFQVSSNCNNFNVMTGSINAYPNPATDVVNLEFNKPEKVNTIRVELLDIAGNVLKTWTLDGETERTSLDVSNYNAGMYNVRVVYDNHYMQNMRVVKVAY